MNDTYTTIITVAIQVTTIYCNFTYVDGDAEKPNLLPTILSDSLSMSIDVIIVSATTKPPIIPIKSTHNGNASLLYQFMVAKIKLDNFILY